MLELINLLYIQKISLDREDSEIMGYAPAFSTPEKGLVAAIILRALRDLYPHKDVAHHYTRHAEEWFISENTTPFSFKWCMDTLEVGASQSDLQKLIKRARTVPILDLFGAPGVRLDWNKKLPNVR